MPWKPRTRQDLGRKVEKEEIKRRGGSHHPMSGAGRIKGDGSTDEELFEVKLADRSHTLKGEDLKTVWQQAIRQGKEPVYIVLFTNGYRAVIGVEKN